MDILPDKPEHFQSPWQIFVRFLRFGCLAWGGPVAQIAMLRQELVEEEQWVSKERFNRALAVYQVLPGPEATELAVWFGMIAGGRLGGLLAGLAFMLPGFLLMLGMTWVYFRFNLESPVLQAVFAGFQAAVIALIFAAVHRIGKHALVSKPLLAVAVLSSVATVCGVDFFIVLPVVAVAYVFWMKNNIPVAVILAAGLLGMAPGHFLRRFSPLRRILTIAPTRQFSAGISARSFLYRFERRIADFRWRYTVIPFVQEDAVINHSWMTNEQFLDGIAFVGHVAGAIDHFFHIRRLFGAGWLGALLITLAIFLPAFCFTLIGHRVIEKVIDNKALHNFLDGVTAGVIGLIAITALQLFRSTIGDWISLVIFAISLFFLYRVKSKFTVVAVILGSGIISLILALGA